MNSKKPSPRQTTEARQAKDKLEYARLVKEIKERLEHRSPGLYGWIDKGLLDAQAAINSAASSVYYPLDPGLVAAQADIDLARERIIHELDPGLVAAQADIDLARERIIHELDPALVAAQADIDAGYTDIREDTDIDVDNTTTIIERVIEYVTTTVTKTVDKAGDIINKISHNLGVSFDAAMFALAGLPALLTGWRDELADFMKFDVDEFMTAMQTMSEKMRGKEG